MKGIKHQDGFTLIELMIVVAIIGILAAIALPAYQTYQTKAKLVEAMTDLDVDKIAISEVFQTNAAFPATASPPIATVVNGNAQYVTAVAYNSAGGAGAGATASVVVTLGNTGATAIDGKFLGMFAVGNADGSITWTCGTGTAATVVAAGAVKAMYPYLPAKCQN